MVLPTKLEACSCPDGSHDWTNYVILLIKGSEIMMRRRRRRQITTVPGQKSPNPGYNSRRKSVPITSILKNIDLTSLSGQMHGIANHMEKFGQFRELMNLGGIFGGLGGGKGLNFMSLFKDGNSLDHLLQAISPVFKDAGPTDEKKGEPKKVEPISVETRPRKKG